MYHICSVADNKFINNVLALDFSLKKYSHNYTLHLLCLDDLIFNHIKNNPPDNIKLYLIEDLLSSDPLLQQSKTNKPSREAIVNAKGDYELATQIQFIWSLSSYFTNFCLHILKDINSILYVDSDIYFFDNWEKIFLICEEYDINIGLVEHRIPFIHNNGKYNVGIIYFKNNNIGKQCSELWKSCLLNTNNEFYNEYGDCGDQKYLELFPKLYDRVFSLDQYFGHLAPWNFQFHKYMNNQIMWENKLQNVMYCHFSNFKPDYTNNTYLPAPRHGINNISHNAFLKNIYNEYFTQLKKYHENYIRNDYI
jgi:hypothetical protein